MTPVHEPAKAAKTLRIALHPETETNVLRSSAYEDCAKLHAVALMYVVLLAALRDGNLAAWLLARHCRLRNAEL